MRLAALGLSHETNTFASHRATHDSFTILRGDEVIAHHATAQSTMAGFLEAREWLGVEVVPLMFASVVPCGLISRDAYDRISGEMLDLLERNGPWDAVLLAQHGAAVAEGVEDVDGEIAARVRRLVGAHVPIGMSIDMHANVSQRMIDHTTVTTIYQTNPHVDARPRALECAGMIVRSARGEIRPVQALETPPLVINIVKQFTDEEPMRSLVAGAHDAAARPGMLSASVAEGYPYADVPKMGMAFLAVHDGDPTAARDAARRMARRAWERRLEFLGDVPGPDDALRQAMAAPAGPVVLMDVGDNIPGGSAADSTYLLAAARQLGVRRYLQTLYDPEAVAACVAAGEGGRVELAVGGKTDHMHGAPVTVTGRVRRITSGVFEDTRPTHGGQRFFDAGTSAALDTDDEMTLVLHTKRIGNTSIEEHYSIGVLPEEYQVVVAKGVWSPRPAYAPAATHIILVNTPGVTTADLSFFDYQHRRRPLYPFELDARYEPD